MGRRKKKSLDSLGSIPDSGPTPLGVGTIIVGDIEEQPEVIAAATPIYVFGDPKGSFRFKYKLRNLISSKVRTKVLTVSESESLRVAAKAGSYVIVTCNVQSFNDRFMTLVPINDVEGLGTISIPLSSDNLIHSQCVRPIWQARRPRVKVVRIAAAYYVYSKV